MQMTPSPIKRDNVDMNKLISVLEATMDPFSYRLSR